MSDSAPAIGLQTRRSAVLTMGVLAAVLLVILIAASAAAPYVFKGATLEGEVAAQLRTTTGLEVVSSGHARFSLLPAPHVEIADLALAGPDHAVTVAAGTLDGDVRLLPLLVGRLELDSATLTRPTLTIDADAAALPADSTVGRALRGAGPMPAASSARLGTVTLVDGTAIVRSRSLARPPRFERINATLDWPDAASPATLTGALEVDGIATDVAAWVAQPATLMRGESSPIALRIHATPLDLSANGDLSNAGTPTFRGHAVLSTPSLPALLARFGLSTGLVAPFANIALDADTTIMFATEAVAIDLQSLRLDLDGNHYEGTLAYAGTTRPALSGTLATDTLNLAPFLANEPSFSGADHRWTRTAFPLAGADVADLDLRVSANHLKIAPFTIDDAALSVMTRGVRTEVALNEGKAYGGTIKGRASVGVQGGVLSVRGAGTVTQADLAAVAWDALGRQVATGTLSGALNIETSGDNPSALMAHLQGWVKGDADDGEMSGLDLSSLLQDADPHATTAAAPQVRRGRTPFTSASFSARLVDGTATIEAASLRGPTSTATLVGSVDIGTRRLDLEAIATPPGGASATPRLVVDIKGPFDAPTVAPVPASASKGK